MKVINFAEHQTVVNRYMSELRDVCIQKDRARFRRNLERIGEVMAYEISKTLDYSTKDIQTPLARHLRNCTTTRLYWAPSSGPAFLSIKAS